METQSLAYEDASINLDACSNFLQLFVSCKDDRDDWLSKIRASPRVHVTMGKIVYIVPVLRGARSSLGRVQAKPKVDRRLQAICPSTSVGSVPSRSDKELREERGGGGGCCIDSDI